MKPLERKRVFTTKSTELWLKLEGRYPSFSGRLTQIRVATSELRSCSKCLSRCSLTLLHNSQLRYSIPSTLMEVERFLCLNLYQISKWFVQAVLRSWSEKSIKRLKTTKKHKWLVQLQLFQKVWWMKSKCKLRSISCKLVKDNCNEKLTLRWKSYKTAKNQFTSCRHNTTKQNSS